MTPTLSRRALMLGAGAGAALSLVPLRAAAVTTDQATQLVNALVADINAVIASGKSEGAMIGDFANLFVRYGDTPTIAQYVLGNAGRSATPQQRQRFTQAYTSYVAQKYGSRFREFIGSEIRVESAQAVNNYVSVTTTAYLRGESPFRVDFHISDGSGQAKMFNLVVEGVNMLLSERTEIAALLDRNGGNVDAMIAAISG
ncbi:ABC transporter substrate-binding protein [Pelagovum pacificum]|uniref:ABC transporter substrate-binding protein n=1 Tax=Pelagovum pacificum TaxID=2588711 RepID=A0A5C5GJ61_9RHOB|nr:ABC transporter substrate-binding protein [Pelagovum pacificum]QQA42605.1 ABC transporter substrate-binding protein [Pelagovum pacificum]TNY34244.1 ABC transporter substrate-binding protein [Pelagovum pacificum]